MEKPDGTRVPLKCGKVKKGDGLIIVTIQAFDPNMSYGLRDRQGQFEPVGSGGGHHKYTAVQDL